MLENIYHHHPYQSEWPIHTQTRDIYGRDWIRYCYYDRFQISLMSIPKTSKIINLVYPFSEEVTWHFPWAHITMHIILKVTQQNLKNGVRKLHLRFFHEKNLQQAGCFHPPPHPQFQHVMQERRINFWDNSSMIEMCVINGSLKVIDPWFHEPKSYAINIQLIYRSHLSKYQMLYIKDKYG